MTPLSFGNFTKATTNGSQLGSQDFGVSNLNLGTEAPQTQSTNLAGMGTTDTTTVLNQNQQAQTGGQGNFWSQNGGAGMILGGVQVLGSLWNSYQQHKIAKEQMSFAREQWDTNLENQTRTYNTALEDRIRARHAYSGQSNSDTDKYLEEHSL